MPITLHLCKMLHDQRIIHMRTELISERLRTYLEQDISPQELVRVLDEHLYQVVQLAAAAGEPITMEQATAYHHIRNIRDLIGQEHGTP